MSENMPYALQPCPFCNEADLIIRSTTHEKIMGFWVFCLGCFTEGPFDVDKYSAISKWNKRPNEAALMEEIDRLYHLLPPPLDPVKDATKA